MSHIVYLDTETGSADRLWYGDPGFVRLAAYAIGNAEVIVTTDISTVVAEVARADFVVGHNILAYDLPALARYHGLDLAQLVRTHRVIDTYIVGRLADPPLSGGGDERRYGLDAMCKRYGIGSKLTDEESGVSALARLARDHGGYDRIPVDDPTYRAYAREDVELVRGLARVLRVDHYAAREHQIMWRLGHITSSGWRVDVDSARRIVSEQQERVGRWKALLHERFGLPLCGARPHTTSAGKVALELAFQSLGVEPPRTSKGAIATGKEALSAFAEQHPDKSELLELCSVLRALNEERSTAQMLLDHTAPDGRIHPDVDARQATGRISITKPGLTVLGKRDRENILERALLLPDPGHVLLCADLSQIDARAMAAHSQDPDYLQAFEPGMDLHSEMAAAVFGEDGWNRAVGHHPLRSEAKALTHATSYGMGARRLSESAGISLEEAQQHLARLDQSYPYLAAFKAVIRRQAAAQVLRTAFGRWVRVQPGKEYTQAPAFMGQGTARDLMMEGILRLPEWLLPGLRAIVHDEIVLSVPIDRADEAEEAILGALQFEYRITPDALSVPILAEKGDRGADWADCYRSEKPGWPEVARAHRDQPNCTYRDCTWHTNNTTEEIAA